MYKIVRQIKVFIASIEQLTAYFKHLAFDFFKFIKN